MKCLNCGHEYSPTFARCSRCKQANPGRAQSNLLAFRQKTQPPGAQEVKDKELPAWRLEIKKRVNEAKARQNGASLIEQTFPETAAKPAGNSLPTTVSPIPSPALSSKREISVAAVASNSSLSYSLSRERADKTAIARPTTLREERSHTQVKEAALDRVRKASENASRAMLPQIGLSTAKSPTQSPIMLDREATARALEPIQIKETSLQPMASRLPQPADLPEDEPIRKSTALPANGELIAEPSVYASYSSFEADTDSADFDFAEIEPRDYLAEEISKVSNAPGSQITEVLCPSLMTHATIHAIDLLVIALSSTPFYMVMAFTHNASLITGNLPVALLIPVMVGFFYLLLSQSLAGRTFGMMFTMTKVVTLRTCEAPTLLQIMLRTLLYFFSVGLAFIGILWTAFEGKRRGWHDILSGTIIIDGN